MSDKETTAVAVKDRKPQMQTAARAVGGLVPRNMDELWRFAMMVSQSKMAPKDMQDPETIAVAVQMGMEVGLSPMQALQNIAVINGRPSIWGDAALGLVQSSGLLESFVEEPIEDGKGNTTGYHCTAKRRSNPHVISRTFTAEMAKRAGLWIKAIWKQYPERMLQMRARAWVLRDGFADCLKGLSVREEAVDIPATVLSSEPIERTNPLAAGRHDTRPAPKAIEATAEAVEPSREPVDPQPQPDPDPEPEPCIAKGQTARLKALRKSKALTAKDWTEHLSTYGVASGADLTEAQAGQLIAWLETRSPDPAPAFDRAAALKEIGAYAAAATGPAWTSYVTACEAIKEGMNPEAPDALDDADLDKLLSRVRELSDAAEQAKE